MNSEFQNIRRIAVISDTHGYLASNLTESLKKVDLIIHAGDMDGPDVLKTLKNLAPVLAVRGNMDRGNWAKNLNPTELASVEGMLLYVLHDLLKLDIDPESIGVKLVISGHTHQPQVEKKDKVIYLNPGSASLPKAGQLPSYALITINDHKIDIEIKDL